MFNFVKKYSAAFLFLYISSANSMITKFLPETFFGYSYTRQYTNQANLDRELWNVIRAYKKDFKQIEECLNKGANPNVQNEHGHTSLIWATFDENTDLLKFLIQHGADINLKCIWQAQDGNRWTPLGRTILSPNRQQSSIIEILCDSGASLVNLNNYNPTANAFHYAVRGTRKEIIQTLMTHARFDSFDQYQEQKERKVLATLSVLFELPKDVRFYILGQLILVDDAYSSNEELGKKLLKKGYTWSLPFIQANKRVKNLTKMLDSEDGYYELTPSEWVSNFNHSFPDQYNKEILALIDKNKLRKNWDDFNYGFPGILKSDPNNPICEMYNNCKKLLKSKKK